VSGKEDEIVRTRLEQLLAELRAIIAWDRDAARAAGVVVLAEQGRLTKGSDGNRVRPGQRSGLQKAEAKLIS
jgi:hypothetical protein